VPLAQDGSGAAMFKLEPFAYDNTVGPIQFFIVGSVVPAGVTFDPDIAVRADPMNPMGPPLGNRIWGNPGSTTSVKVTFAAGWDQLGLRQPVQVLVIARTMDGRTNNWWASIQPQ